MKIIRLQWLTSRWPETPGDSSRQQAVGLSHSRRIGSLSLADLKVKVLGKNRKLRLAGYGMGESGDVKGGSGVRGPDY